MHTEPHTATHTLDGITHDCTSHKSSGCPLCCLKTKGALSSRRSTTNQLNIEQGWERLQSLSHPSIAAPPSLDWYDGLIQRNADAEKRAVRIKVRDYAVPGQNDAFGILGYAAEGRSYGELKKVWGFWAPRQFIAAINAHREGDNDTWIARLKDCLGYANQGLALAAAELWARNERLI